MKYDELEKKMRRYNQDKAQAQNECDIKNCRSRICAYMERSCNELCMAFIPSQIENGQCYGILTTTEPRCSRIKG